MEIHQQHTFLYPKKSFLILTFTMILMFILSSNLYAQNDKKVSGKVTNNKGESIPGASVKIKNTSTGIATDIDVSLKPTIKISFVSPVDKNSST